VPQAVQFVEVVKQDEQIEEHYVQIELLSKNPILQSQFGTPERFVEQVKHYVAEF
jgi:hypothetical protein